jgi:hypothetical protein
MSDECEIVTYADVLSDYQHRWLYDRFRKPKMRWQYLDNVSSHVDQNDPRYHRPSLAMNIFDRDMKYFDGDLYPECDCLIHTIVKELNLDHLNLARVRLGMYLPFRNVDTHNPIHVDRHTPHTTVIYYLDSNDGDTLFFDIDNKVIHRQSPEANQAVVFDGMIKHASTNPSSGTRLTLNINLDSGISEY